MNRMTTTKTGLGSLLGQWFIALCLIVGLSACEIEGDSLSDDPMASEDDGGDTGGGNDGGNDGGSDGGNDGGDGGMDGGDGNDGGGEDEMPPPVDPDPPMDDAPPTDMALFEATLYPKLTDQANFCVGCHGATQIPTFAVMDVEAAYNALVSQQKVNLNAPEQSRVYLRAAVDRHNCGGDTNCDRAAMEFLAAIQDWATQATANQPPPSAGNEPVMSAKLTLADGLDGAAARVDDAVIAKFEFKEGAGDVAMDTSGVGNPIALQLEGTEWVDGGGIRNVSGKAQASVDDSRKLFDMITPAMAYTVEAWVIPDNNAQDGPARMVSYSQDTAVRNFTMGQNAIYYVFRNRTGNSDNNGTPQLEAVGTEVDTVLQHVVMTYDATNGRKIYINGQLDIEEDVADPLAWTDDQILVIGNEVTNNRIWQGVIRSVHIHNKALNAGEVAQNFDAGADTFVTLRFDVAEAVGAPAFIEMQAAQLDDASYVFARPVFVSDTTGVAVKNIRIGVNDVLPVAAQAFRRVDTTVLQTPAELSPLGALIPATLGPDADVFHLEFEVLGNRQGPAETVAPPAPPVPAPDVEEPVYGVRTFSEVNETMAAITGIDPGRNAVEQAYEELRDSLPPTFDLNAFGAAQQIAIQRLAKAYCGEVVNNNGTCTDFFGACEIGAGQKAAVADAIYDRVIGVNLVNQPERAAVNTALVTMIDDLGCANGCNGDQGELVLQAACTATLSSAAVTVH